ncbi:hypothetical protein Leryth_009070 [Lithospermum erythrorhizon]|nr:hypothetical protein Leryth_009070 [Lithospermum erythrorhizon]
MKSAKKRRISEVAVHQKRVPMQLLYPLTLLLLAIKVYLDKKYVIILIIMKYVIILIIASAINTLS